MLGALVVLSLGVLSGAALDQRIVVLDARLGRNEPVDVLIVDGIIEAIGTIELRPGDVAVRARGGEVIVGRRRTLGSFIEWSELVEGPALGVTSVVLPPGAFDPVWLGGVRARSAWVGPRLATPAEARSQPRIEPGFPAELLVLSPESRAIEQAVVGDEVLRRADLETRREMLAKARRGLAELPPPESGLRSLHVVAAGLPIGRVDVRPDGSLIHERTVAPRAADRVWEIGQDSSGWTVVLREDGAVRATIRGDATGVTAESATGGRMHHPPIDGRPAIDLAATAATASDRLVQLPPEGTLELPVASLVLSPEGLTVGPDRLRFRRCPSGALPFPIQPSDRGFEVRSGDRLRGLVVLGPDGFPVRAWETDPVGDIEWIVRPRTAPERSGPATQTP